MKQDPWTLIEKRLRGLYGKRAPQCRRRLQMMIGRYGVGDDAPSPLEHLTGWDQRDAVLITYGDMVSHATQPPLQALTNFVRERLPEAVNTVHLLPFFPYSSDDGFSVIDYRVVDSKLGGWQDITELGRTHRLMFDLVINHVSRKSGWFKNYVNGIAPHRDYFIEADPEADHSRVTRPRPLPLLTETQTRTGTKWVWTTFSADQIDVDFSNPDVLFEYLDILFDYLSKGARIIRLDAIAYLWKTPGTTCIHLPQTHSIVKLLRDVVDIVAPQALLLTETNVPHEENISYFGKGDEAHMVYQFSLPPLVAQGLLTESAEHLTRWAKALPALKRGQAYFNFTASHDGIGVRPLQGLMPDDAIAQFVEQAQKAGAKINLKRNEDGSESPYELNITYFDLFSDEASNVTEQHIARFLSSQAIMLAWRGIPGIYFNSLIGARNNYRGMAQTGHNRTINRQKWMRGELDKMLDDHKHPSAQVFEAYRHLLAVRREHVAFHPDGEQTILDFGNKIFAMERTAPNGEERILSITNFTAKKRTLPDSEQIPDTWTDLISSEKGTGPIPLPPYQTRWITGG